MLLLLQVLVSVRGNSATATKLQTARTISLSGDVTGSVSFDGSKNVAISSKLAKFTVITGSITGDNQQTSQTVYANYPSGFTKNNCIVISASFKNKENTNIGYCLGTSFLPVDVSSGSVVSAIRLTNENIVIAIRNIYIDSDGSITNFNNRSLDYKIVLMKI